MSEFALAPRLRPGASPAAARPIKLAISAIGGQGGGVLADWIVSLADANGYLAQYTSVQGVAQRTGATIYYIELFPAAAALAEGREPVMAMMPAPGDVDVVIAAELMEAGRAMVRGFVTADRTTLIASSHRIYGVTEKTAMGDGIAKTGKVIEAAHRRAKRLVMFDMAAVAEAHGSVISAVLFGALAGSDALPFPPAAYEAAIVAGGVGVKASLAAFAAGRDAAGPPPVVAEPASPAPAPVSASSEEGRALLARIARDFPPSAQPVLAEGVRRLADYQDRAYAAEYLDRLSPVAAADIAATSHLLTLETARGLALWMSYEDTIRVADLKTRRARFDRVRGEVRAKPNELLYMSEYMHPRLEEVCDTLPAALGAWVLRTPRMTRMLSPLFGQGRRISTAKLSGFLTLHGLAALRGTRRGSLRHACETAAFYAWLARIVRLAPVSYDLAVEVALCQNLVKGYGETHARGMSRFDAIMVEVDAGAADAARVRRLRAAALADEAGKALTAELRAPAA